MTTYHLSSTKVFASCLLPGRVCSFSVFTNTGQPPRPPTSPDSVLPPKGNKILIRNHNTHETKRNHHNSNWLVRRPSTCRQPRAPPSPSLVWRHLSPGGEVDHICICPILTYTCVPVVANNFWGKEDAGVQPLLERMSAAKQTCDELRSFYAGMTPRILLQPIYHTVISCANIHLSSTSIYRG